MKWLLIALAIGYTLLACGRTCEDSGSKSTLCSFAKMGSKEIVDISRSVWANAGVAVYSGCSLMRNPSGDGCLELALNAAGGSFILEVYLRDHPSILTRGWEAMKMAIGLGPQDNEG